MEKFRTQYNNNLQKFFTNCGKPVKTKKKLSYDKKGNMMLIDDGEINLYDEIQSHSDSVDIHVLLKRFKAGDYSCINNNPGGFFGDVSSFPTSYAEILNTVISAENTFKELPTNIKAAFDNDLGKFIASLDNLPEFYSKLGYKPDLAHSKEDTKNDATINDATNKEN